nr:GNAT family N-acetyltransferase [Paenibacillus tianjinensis]
MRRATVDDAEDLARLNFEFNGGEPRPCQDIIASLRSNQELVAVALMLDEVVAFGCAQSYRSFCYPGAYGEITEMYVSEVGRRKGAATALIAFLEQELSYQGVTSVKILTGKTNNPALKTYQASGYITSAETVLLKEVKRA